MAVAMFYSFLVNAFKFLIFFITISLSSAEKCIYVNPLSLIQTGLDLFSFVNSKATLKLNYLHVTCHRFLRVNLIQQQIEFLLSSTPLRALRDYLWMRSFGNPQHVYKVTKCCVYDFIVSCVTIIEKSSYYKKRQFEKKMFKTIQTQ